VERQLVTVRAKQPDSDLISSGHRRWLREVCECSKPLYHKGYVLTITGTVPRRLG
jgi:hypothetical protein